MATITILMWVPLRREGKSYHNVAIPAPIVLRTGFASRLIALWLTALWPKPFSFGGLLGRRTLRCHRCPRF
jgi:hypothetical protein